MELAKRQQGQREDRDDPGAVPYLLCTQTRGIDLGAVEC